MRAHFRQHEIRGEVAWFAVLELEPQSKRPFSGIDGQRERQILAPRRNVGVVETQIKVAVGFLPIRGCKIDDITAQINGRGELGGRHPGETKTMVAEAVLEAKLHLIEHELRRFAKLVVPGDERIADDDLPLAQQPVAEQRVFARPLGVDRHAGDAKPSAGIAADRKFRAVDDELAQTEIEQRQRCPCDDQIDARKIQQRLVRICAIADAKPANRQLRIPTVPTGGDRVDLDRLAESIR